MQTILSRHPKAKVRVFAVWEPILMTDWSAPGSFVRGRLSDDRVRQFWDPQHMVAAQMSRDAHRPQPEPHCCDDRGILWDLAAVYPHGTEWGSSLPAAVLCDGPVAEVAENVERLVAASKISSP